MTPNQPQATQGFAPGGRPEPRHRFQTARAALAPGQQAAAAAAVIDPVIALAAAVGAEVVCGFHAVRGELDPGPALGALRRAGCVTAYPRIDGESMVFCAVDDPATMRPATLGIPAPAADLPAIEASSIDLVIVPLVSFDDQGNRLGMGGGYYDRTFSGPRSPVLVGLAHDLQRSPRLRAESWDVPLDAVITPTAIWRYRFGR